MVPDGWDELPFVDEPRSVTAQEEGRVDEAGAARLIVHIEADLTRGYPAGRLALAAAARAFDHDGTGGRRVVHELAIDDARAVVDTCFTDPSCP